MKRYSFIFFISVVICIVQQAIFSRIEILNVGFDAVFVFLICFTLLNNDIESLIIALLCGLIRDSFFPYLFGINSVVYIASAFILTQISKKIYKESILIPISLTFALSLFKNIMYYAYFYISSIRFDFQSKALGIMLGEALYNSIISFFVYKLIKRIIKLKIMQQEWKF